MAIILALKNFFSNFNCGGHEEESCDGFVGKSHDRSVNYTNNLINGNHYGHHYPLMAINKDNCH